MPSSPFQSKANNGTDAANTHAGSGSRSSTTTRSSQDSYAINTWLNQKPQDEPWNRVSRMASSCSRPSKADAERQLAELNDEMKKSA